MSSVLIADLAGFGAPGLAAAITLLITTCEIIQNVKIYRQQCIDLSGRCVNLMLSLREHSIGLEGTRAIELPDEITAILFKINKKVNEWAALSRIQSFLQQSDIKEGLDKLHRDLDATMMTFNISVGLGNMRVQEESKAIRERDRAEIRDLWAKIMESQQDLKMLRSLQPSRLVQDVINSFETELHNPNLEPSQEESFQKRLSQLHQKITNLSPLEDLTGQVTLTHNDFLARGAYNNVFLGEWHNHEPPKVALRLPQRLAKNRDAQKRFQREVAIWRTFKHENVVPLYGIARIGEDIYTVCPWMEHGTAISYVQMHATVDRLRILNEVATGLEYLHLNGIVHGDLRCANILITGEITAVLADFGLSKFLEDCGPGISSSSNLTSRWSAPELLLSANNLATTSDVWSFGMVCLELMTGEQPFNNIPQDYHALRELDRGKVPERPGRLATAQGLNDDLWSLMKACWHKKPESRPTMTVIKTRLSEMRGTTIASARSVPPKQRSKLSLPRFLRPIVVASPRSKPAPALTILSQRVGTLPEDNGFAGSAIGSSLDKPRPSDSLAPGALLLSRGSPSLSGHSELGTANLAIPSSASSSPSFSRTSSDSHSAPRSTVSIDSGIQVNSSVEDVVTEKRPTVHVDKGTGTVLSGTLEGLIEKLISGLERQEDYDYRESFFIGCTDFITWDDLFGILVRKFHEAGWVPGQPQRRVTVQLNIVTIVHYWLTSPHLSVNSQLLRRMKTFCVAVRSIKSSTTMHDKVIDLLSLIDNQARSDPSTSAISRPLPQQVLRTSEISPTDIAIALTLLEGDKYKAILPIDYIAHLTRKRRSNVEAACLTNTTIVLWVKQSVLNYDTIRKRAKALGFFVNTAKACLTFHNYSSATAIIRALHSEPIKRLRLTDEELSRDSPKVHKTLGQLHSLLDPSSNYQNYRTTLQEKLSKEVGDRCIPWIFAHLENSRLSLPEIPRVVGVDGIPLINFEPYVRFTERVKEMMQYKPPDLEKHRQQGHLAYLEKELREVHSNTDNELMKRSEKLEADEALAKQGRTREMKGLGFRT